MNLRLHVRSFSRAEVPSDRFVGDHLVEMLMKASAAGRTGAAAVVVRSKTIDGLDLSALRGVGLPLAWFLAGLTTTSTLAGGPVEAVGVMGRVGFRRTGPDGTVPVATVFLEWGDNRWWQWQARLGPDGTPIPETAQVRSASAGDAMPQGLGRWWSAARRRRIHVGLTPLSSPGDGGIVH